jgi:hypothetical protein
MGFLDRLLGREPRTQQPPYAAQRPAHPVPGGGLRHAAGDDERAVARYRYLLRTAPPEALEQVHAEAFAPLTPEQRSQVLAELSRDMPAGERPPGADPQSLARSATRAELRQPGYLEHAFSRGRFGGGAGGMGMGMGGSIVGSMMGTIAGVVIGSALADALFDGYADSPEAAEAGDTGGADAAASDTSTADTSASDTGGADAGGADYAGGDFGGGGFGDFGGGDFGGDF